MIVHMEKNDLKKTFKDLYVVPRNKMVIVDVPQMNYVAIDGTGDPNTAVAFQEAVQALFSIAYTIKFMVKKGPLQVNYGVMPLEGQWWTDDMNNFAMERKEDWQWSLMIMQPQLVTHEIYEEAMTIVRKRSDLPALHKLRLETMTDGLCAQILHTGPYSEEPATIMKLHQFIADQGYRLTGRHREIYLSDMRRTAPEHLKTIIRQPITR